MTRPQVVALVVVNALVSLVISLAVVLVFARYISAGPTGEGDPQVVAAAQAAAAPTATTVPVAGDPAVVATYVVKSGDSLGSIASKHGVSLDALMAANSIDNANFITVGQSLVIPSGGAVIQSTPTPRDLPTVAPVLTPENGDAPVVVEAINRSDSVADEYVTVVNRGAQGVALAGWTLEDGDGNLYTFPNLFLWRSGTVLVHTGAGTDSATDLYWGRADPVWDRADDRLVLRDARGDTVSEAQIGEGSAG